MENVVLSVEYGPPAPRVLSLSESEKEADSGYKTFVSAQEKKREVTSILTSDRLYVKNQTVVLCTTFFDLIVFFFVNRKKCLL